MSFDQVKWIKTISPVVLAYAGGIILANIGLGLDVSMLTEMTQICIPIAICLLLVSTNLKDSIVHARPALLSFFLIILSVLIVSIISSFVFREQVKDSWKIAGMLVGVFTGGTPNMSAIGQSLDVEPAVFILMNAADLIMGAIYLLVILSFGPSLYEKVLRKTIINNDKAINCNKETEKIYWYQYTLNTILGVGVLGVCAIFSIIFFGEISGGFVIFSLTTISILFSLVPKVRNMNGSYRTGEYFLLVFCFSVGAMANINQLLSSSITYFLFFAFVMLLSILFHTIAAKFLKIDSHTAIITSIAALFGPAFIAPVVARLKNNSLLVPGIATGLLGYVLGNYLGLMIAYLCKNL